ncbi:uncharacterized protein DEA37_0014526 [Paragonimus westermani]|uniref:Reverse transcriptase domain-containing protein n=1 Tax=Paragonimus westermani TaxID=34504 RepID=A0A5J4NPG7_9TREM|nr:uncharacterized protein DEA37_0014526 [Paragonimus westermani]
MAETALLELLQQQQRQMQQQQDQIEQQQKMMQRHQQVFLEQQQTNAKMFESLTAQLAALTTSRTAAISEPKLKETLATGIHEFNYDPDNGVTFSSWYQRYEDIFLVDAAALDEFAKVRLLMQKLGAAEHAQYCNYILPQKSRDFTLKDTVSKLCSIFGERTSAFNIRYNCLKISRHATEDIVTYAGRVNRECERFQLKQISDSQFKALIFVAGLTSSEDADIRTRLLAKLDSCTDFSVQDLTAEYLRLVNLKHDSQMLQSTSSPTDIASVDRVIRHNRPSYVCRDAPFRMQRPSSACWLCGQWHFVRFCPYRRHVCQQCNCMGHKESHCRQSTQGFRVRRQSNVVFTTTSDIVHRRKYMTLHIENHQVTLQIDTASDITIISRLTWINLGRPPYKPTHRVAKNASGHQIPFLGELMCTFCFRDKCDSGICYISPYNHLNLLGIDWIEKLDLWNVPFNSVCDVHNTIHLSTFCDVAKISSKLYSDFVQQLPDKFPDVFTNNLGKCTKGKAQLFIEPGSRPVFCPKRPVPYSTTAALEAELDRLEAIGVLSKVNYSSWAAPVVTVKKANGSIRLCGDFSTGLNKALQTHQYPLSVPEDLFTRLNGGKIFSKIDFSDAYLQVEVDDSCKDLLTINTHRGLYRYNRLPFGVKCAPAIFQQIMDTMLNCLAFAVSYMDDIIIVSPSPDEHKTHLEQVFNRIHEYGFTLRKQKCEFFLPQIKYLGFIVDCNGRRPDPAKISAIKDLPSPTNRVQLQSFLGLVNYYNSFVPNMHQLRAPLNNLLRKDTKWVWSHECQSAFDSLKRILSSDLLLTHYDPNLPIIVAADASDYGIGAVILHQFPDGHQKAISHASRTLLPAERNYSQIEKEGLALIFAVKKFHKMLHGRRFTLCTDHKPLLSILAPPKGIPVHTANRLQRWATLLIGYDFVLKYIQTERFGHADALSRLIAHKSTNHPSEDVVISSVEVDADVKYVFRESIRNLPVTSTMIRRATQSDPVLQAITYYLRTGWPKELCAVYKPYFQRRDALTVVDGCLMLADRIVIPQILRKRVIQMLHCAHPGITRMKALVRSYAYWPGIDSDIESTVKSCEQCARAAKVPVKAELHSWPLPDGPWKRVHADFAGPLNDQYFLIRVDAFSKWPEIVPIRTISTTTTYLLSLVFQKRL